MASCTVVYVYYNQLTQQPLDRAETGAVIEAPMSGDVERLYQRMVRAEGLTAPCPVSDGIALIDTEVLSQEVWGCLRITNRGPAGTWRVDFGDIRAQDVTFWVVRPGVQRPVLTSRTNMAAWDRESGTRRLVSAPISIAADETIELWAFFPLSSQFGLSDPSLRPELAFDAESAARAHLYGGLLVGSGLLVLFFGAFAALLKSRPARRYAIYYGLIWLTIAAREGYLAALVPVETGNLAGITAVVLLFAVGLTYFRFVGAFVQESLPGSALGAVGGRLFWDMLILIGAAIGLLALGIGVQVAILLGALPGLEPAQINDWILGGSVFLSAILGGAIIVAPVYYAIWSGIALVRQGTDGSGFFAVGACVLALGGLLTAMQLPAQFGVAQIWARSIMDVVWFVDALVFSAAIVRQTFGLRRQRDVALAAELEASQEQVRLTETLLAAHQDLDRARQVAEQHRSKLAMTSHDLRQPLMSLKLALDQAEAAPPVLKERLASGLDYLRSVLAEARPEPKENTESFGRLRWLPFCLSRRLDC